LNFELFAGDIISGVGFRPFWLKLPSSWAPTARWNSLTQFL